MYQITQPKGSIRRAETSKALFVPMEHFDHIKDWNISSFVMNWKIILCNNILESALIQLPGNREFDVGSSLGVLDTVILKYFRE